jgi:hypothetical protein
MQDFTQSLPFLIFFIVGTLLFHMAFGDQMTQNFLILVLLSMIVFNVDKIQALLRKVKFQ